MDGWKTIVSKEAFYRMVGQIADNKFIVAAALPTTSIEKRMNAIVFCRSWGVVIDDDDDGDDLRDLRFGTL